MARFNFKKQEVLQQVFASYMSKGGSFTAKSIGNSKAVIDIPTCLTEQSQ